MGALLYRDLGLVDYGQGWKLQQELFEGVLSAKKAGQIAPQTVILCEHPHVYTLGRSGKQNNMLISAQQLDQIGATYYHTDRGGDITYHGPGQLVGYPILDLDALGVGLREYIELVEQAVIECLAEFGVQAGRSAGDSGVWLVATDSRPLRKICAIGVRASRFVTMHGFALNVNTDLQYFSYINPCGFTDRGVTSIESEIGQRVEMADVKRVFKEKFSPILGLTQEDYKC